MREVNTADMPLQYLVALFRPQRVRKEQIPMNLLASIALLPNLPGFYNAATHTSTFPALFDQCYSYAWFLGIGIAFVLYYILHLGSKKHA